MTGGMSCFDAESKGINAMSGDETKNADSSIEEQSEKIITHEKELQRDLENLYKLIYHHSSNHGYDFWGDEGKVFAAFGIQVEFMKAKYINWLRPNRLKMFIEGRFNACKGNLSITTELEIIKRELTQIGFLPNEKPPTTHPQMICKFVVGPNGKQPTKADPGAGGYDLYSAEQITINPGEIKLVDLDLKSEFDPSIIALLRDRSGMAKNGLFVTAGVIDSSYRGTWKALLTNQSKSPFVCLKGDRIIQVLFLQLSQIELQRIDENMLNKSERGEGGFGSTGR